MLLRHQGSTYRFASPRPGATLELKRDGTSASIVLSERSGGCADVATTGERAAHGRALTRARGPHRSRRAASGSGEHAVNVY